MELYQLRTFIAVADEEHLTRASERLNASQPAVSSHIKALEDELGVELFLRTPKGMEITSDGAILIDQAQKVLQEANSLLFKARSLHGEVAGAVKLGLNAASSLLKTQDISERIKDNHPQLELHLLHGISGQISRDIRSGTLDGGYAFGENPYPGDLEFVTLKQHTLVIVGPSQWQDEILGADWPQLAAFPWVWASQDCPWRKLVEDVFKEKGLHPTATAYTDNDAVTSSLVVAGAGIGLMLEDEARRFVETDEVCIWEKEKFPITLSFAYMKNRLDDPLLLLVLAGIKQVWGLT